MTARAGGPPGKRTGAHHGGAGAGQVEHAGGEFDASTVPAKGWAQ
jgi:hypothetical protein